ncbi:MAG TPA: CYTH domain-containing protein, partial [Patescibacteria group bacterium]|nr:CYTH domain-containing protein [Patescibacteria group bacterium]
AHSTMDLLTQLGFQVAWSYPKRRTAWNLDGVTITLDQLEFGWFVELEGPTTVLPEMARSLGLDHNQALRESYSMLARQFMKARSARPARTAPAAAQPGTAPPRATD